MPSPLAVDASDNPVPSDLCLTGYSMICCVKGPIAKEAMVMSEPAMAILLQKPSLARNCNDPQAPRLAWSNRCRSITRPPFLKCNHLLWLMHWATALMKAQLETVEKMDISELGWIGTLQWG